MFLLSPISNEAISGLGLWYDFSSKPATRYDFWCATDPRNEFEGDYVDGFFTNMTNYWLGGGVNETKSCAARGICDADLTANVANTITAYVAFSYW